MKTESWEDHEAILHCLLDGQIADVGVEGRAAIREALDRAGQYDWGTAHRAAMERLWALCFDDPVPGGAVRMEDGIADAIRSLQDACKVGRADTAAVSASAGAGSREAEGAHSATVCMSRDGDVFWGFCATCDWRSSPGTEAAAELAVNAHVAATTGEALCPKCGILSHGGLCSWCVKSEAPPDDYDPGASIVDALDRYLGARQRHRDGGNSDDEERAALASALNAAVEGETAPAATGDEELHRLLDAWVDDCGEQTENHTLWRLLSAIVERLERNGR